MTLKRLKFLCFGAYGLMALSGCGLRFDQKLATISEPSCGFFQSPTGARISWSSRTPVSLYVSTNWPSEFRKTVDHAAGIWNEAQNRAFVTVYFDAAAVGATAAQDGLNGLYWMTSWSDQRTNEQGITTLRFKNEKATEADIKINAKNFVFYESTPTEYGQIHLSSLLVHELGHFLGLSHTDVPERVMFPYLSPNFMREKLFPEDLAELACEYGGPAS